MSNCTTRNVATEKTREKNCVKSLAKKFEVSFVIVVIFVLVVVVGPTSCPFAPFGCGALVKVKNCWCFCTFGHLVLVEGTNCSILMGARQRAINKNVGKEQKYLVVVPKEREYKKKSTRER